MTHCSTEAPRIDGSSELRQTLSQNDSLEVPCVARGSPKPIVTWRKDGVLISEIANVRGRIYVDENNTLIIRQLKTSDAGVYLCNATNRAGTDLKVVSLTVRCTLFAPLSVS